MSDAIVEHRMDLMPALSIDEAVARYNAVVEFTKRVMKDGKDYGAIPGTGNKPTLERSPTHASMRLTSASGQAASATSAVFPILPAQDNLFRFWAKSGTSGATVYIRVYWYLFDGTTAASTASVNVISGSELANIGATWRPFLERVTPPSDAVKATVFFYAENGAELFITQPSLN